MSIKTLENAGYTVVEISDTLLQVTDGTTFNVVVRSDDEVELSRLVENPPVNLAVAEEVEDPVAEEVEDPIRERLAVLEQAILDLGGDLVRAKAAVETAQQATLDGG